MKLKIWLPLALAFAMLAAVSVIAYSAASQPGAMLVATVPSGPFLPGDSFSVTLSIEGNPGFAAMPLRLAVPAGLQLTHVHITGFQGLVVTAPAGHVRDTGEITPITGPAYAFVNTFGANNFTADGVLLHYTFRVLNNAATGEIPIYLAFAGARGYSRPINADGEALNIALPGDGGRIGGIYIESHFSITVTPGDARLINAVGQRAKFEITVSGVPAGRFYINGPPVGGFSIKIPYLPNWLAASGYVAVQADGESSGTLILEIIETVGTAKEFVFAGTVFVLP